MILAVVTVPLSACGVLVDLLGPSQSAPSAVRSSAPAAALGARTPGVVTRVADGDTVTIRSKSGEKLKVRLLGIDAPEIAHGAKPADCGGPEAASALRKLLSGRDAILVTDARADDVDRFGRHLGYVEVAGVDAGEQLLASGLAAAWRPKSALEPSRWDAYRAAQQKAQRDRRGAWATCASLGRP